MFEALPVDQVTQGCGGARDRLFVGLNVGPAGFFSPCAQAKGYLLLVLVHLDDLEVMLLACFELDRLPQSIGCLGYMAEAFDTFRDLDEGSELRGAQHFAFDYIADAMLG